MIIRQLYDFVCKTGFCNDYAYNNPTSRKGWIRMISEIGEVIDIVKKHGAQAACDEREHFVEELADVLMFYNDVLLCYGIMAEELKDAYTEKFKRNMKRW